MALKIWEELQLGEFWGRWLTPSRKGTRWDHVLFILVAYRLLSPGAEWRLYRLWYERSALGDLLGSDSGIADIHKLYACHDRLLEHKQALVDHLVGRWRDLFNINFDVLLYDLTSTPTSKPIHRSQKATSVGTVIRGTTAATACK